MDVWKVAGAVGMVQKVGMGGELLLPRRLAFGRVDVDQPAAFLAFAFAQLALSGDLLLFAANFRCVRSAAKEGSPIHTIGEGSSRQIAAADC
jgi:hypothetical protein